MKRSASTWKLLCDDKGTLAPDLKSVKTVFSDNAVVRFEAEWGDKSPGTVDMICVPFGVFGPMYWDAEIQFQQGCFDASLTELADDGNPEVAFIQGNGHYSEALDVVASTRAKKERGIVNFEDTAEGLIASVILPNTNAGRDLAELLDQEVLDSCSVGVGIVKYEVELNEDGTELMTVTEAILDETSIVLRPRFEAAKAKLADAEPDDSEEPEEEELEATADKVEWEALEKLAKRIDKQYARILAELKKRPEPKILEDNSLTNGVATKEVPGWARFNALQKTTY